MQVENYSGWIESSYYYKKISKMSYYYPFNALLIIIFILDGQLLLLTIGFGMDMPQFVFLWNGTILYYMCLIWTARWQHNTKNLICYFITYLRRNIEISNNLCCGMWHVTAYVFVRITDHYLSQHDMTVPLRILSHINISFYVILSIISE